jgi:hypothetical protein
VHASGAEGAEVIRPKCEGSCDISKVSGKRARHAGQWVRTCKTAVHMLTLH